ncbi:MAG: hypothetical protein JWM86_974 [Thermoleophilia bacterium]|nr:hypothetical protein [Thermoleophilia bacterium]
MKRLIFLAAVIGSLAVPALASAEDQLGPILDKGGIPHCPAPAQNPNC